MINPTYAPSGENQMNLLNLNFPKNARNSNVTITVTGQPQCASWRTGVPDQLPIMFYERVNCIASSFIIRRTFCPVAISPFKRAFESMLTIFC
jgi:hypothetical protein